MPAKLFYLPFRPAIDPNGLTVSGAKLYFYAAGTLTPLPVYADEALTVELEHPVMANAAGKWPAIFLDEAVLYRAILEDATGEQLDDADPYLASVADEITPELAGVVQEAQDAAAASATSAGTAAAQVPLAAAEVVKAEAAAAAAALATRGVNMWPDPMFALSAGNPDYTADGYRLYKRPSSSNNATWDAGFKHPYGTGAWVYNSALATLMGFETHLAGPGTGEFELAPGDVVSIAVEVVAASGTVSIAARFFSAVTPTAYTHLGNQINGSAAVVMDGTPKILKVNNLAIPAGAIGFQDYLFDGIASDFKVLRRWIVKSSVAADSPPVRGTTWEVDEIARVAVGDPHGTAVAWMIQPAIVYDGATVVLPVTGDEDGSDNPLIRGWATAMAPAGVAFNAVKVRAIKAATDANPLASVAIVVRKGAANSVQNAGSTVVAVGSIAVNPALTVHPSMTIPLRDPVSGDYITLSDTQLDTDEYAVMVYGLDASGTRTAIVQPEGLTDNQLGRSFYVTTNDPVTAVWLPQGSNTPTGVEHVLLVNIREGFGPTDTYAQQIAEKIGGVTPPDPVATIPLIVEPPTVYSVVGQQMNVYFDNLLADDGAQYLFDAVPVGSDSAQLDECWRWTPTAARTTGNLSIKVHRKIDGLELTSATMAMRAAAANAGAGQTVKACFIGASHTQAGIITQTVLDLAASDVMSVDLIGTRGVAPNLNEGRGGWRIDDYATAGRTYYTFTVSGVTTPPAINATEYSNNGGTFRVQEVNLSGGAGTITCSVSGPAPTASGVLTKSNTGAGDATINFSASAAVPGNPFWIGGQVDFGQYLVNNSLDTPDWVFILLGTNDVFGNTSDSSVEASAATAMAQFDTLINSIKAVNPTIRVGVALIPPPAGEQNAFGANYASGQTRWRAKRNFAIWNRALVTKYAGQEANRIYIVPKNQSVDAVNNYPRSAAAPVNSRNAAVTVARQNNGAHPADSGYQQLGDVFWAFLKYRAANP